ncbi:MAG: hypothetical protein RL387_452 [Bacteroidota bacterium]|jgi:hypothetical protein
MKKYLLSFLACIVSVLFISACFKNSSFATNSAVNQTDSLISIKSLKKLHYTGEFETIRNNMSIEALVVANDESNNLYKTIAVQDSTGGIMIVLDGTNLYQTYPVGAVLRIQLKDLILTDYRRMIQIVAAIDTATGSFQTTGIPPSLFTKHIMVIRDQPIIRPLVVGFKNLHDSLQGRLIKITNIEFASADTMMTYADKKNKIGASRALKFCSGGTIYLRTSGYADFAGIKLPSGNGELVGVYSVYNSEKQVFIRDTSDILLKNKRCTGAAWLKN